MLLYFQEDLQYLTEREVLNLLQSSSCGVSTDHKKGFIFKSQPIKKYLFMHFKTPFFCIINEKRIEGNPGDCLLHPIGSIVIHGPISDNESFINDWIYFSGEIPDELSALPFDTLLTIPGDKIFTKLLASINEEQVRCDVYSKRLISDMIYRLLAIINRSTTIATNNENMTLFSHFEGIRIQILRHYNENWTLQKMAELSGYSVSRFCSLYTSFFKKSPIDDLLDERIKIAKQLLSLQVYSVNDVATLCGFSSLHYFSSYFKKKVGCAPSKY